VGDAARSAKLVSEAAIPGPRFPDDIRSGGLGGQVHVPRGA